MGPMMGFRFLPTTGLLLMLAACSTLLPTGDTEVRGPWHSYADAEKTFALIVPYQTTEAEIKAFKLVAGNPNVALLSYADVLRRFVPAGAVDGFAVDAGVRECLAAKAACQGYEIDQRVSARRRIGGFWLDFLNFKREVDIEGWHFNGVLLVKDGVVIYKLASGQPLVREYEKNINPLGPLQGLGESRLPTR